MALPMGREQGTLVQPNLGEVLMRRLLVLSLLSWFPLSCSSGGGDDQVELVEALTEDSDSQSPDIQPVGEDALETIDLSQPLDVLELEETGDATIPDELMDTELVETSLDPYVSWLAENYPAVVSALEELPYLSDGVSEEEASVLTRFEAVVQAAPEEHRDWVATVLAHRAPPGRTDDSGMLVDGSLGDWPEEGVVELADRDQDVEGADFIDLKSVALLQGLDSLWVRGILAHECSDDMAVMVLLDVDRGLHYDVDMVGSVYAGAHMSFYKYHQDDELFQFLDATGVEWICVGDTIEIRLPWAGLEGLIQKPNASLWLMTYDMDSPEGEDRFDLSPNVLLHTRDYRGAAMELYSLVEAVSDCVDDPWTTLILALQNRFWMDIVEAESINVVLQDSVELLEYALSLPVWQQMYGIPSDFSALPFEAKAVWAWRGQQTMLFGLFASYLSWEKLTAERYRFNAFTADDLEFYRHEFLVWFPEWTDVLDLVGQVDDWMWKKLRYSALPSQMEIWCADGSLSDLACLLYQQDVDLGNLTLGTVDGVDVPNYDAPSASFQRAYYEGQSFFKGDCRTHCVVTTAFYESLGIPATGWQYYPHDDAVLRAIHDLPLFFDTDLQIWRAYQSPTHISPMEAEAHIWYFLPPRDPMLFGLYNVDHDKVGLFDCAFSFTGLSFADMIGILAAGFDAQLWAQRFWASYPDNNVEP